MPIIPYYNIFFYYNMSSYHEIVDSTNKGSRGSYIQTHISNQGILRIFYTDTSGDASIGTKDNIMCSIVDRSNTRQVIYNSAYKRNSINDKDINIAKYGENFKTYLYQSSPPNDSVFGETVSDNSNINKFYIFPMHFQDDQGNQLYNKEGYSATLGKWWDGYFSGMALNIKNGWYAQLSGNVPDNYRFVNPIQTMTNALTEPNTGKEEQPNMTQSKFTEDGTKIQENSEDNIIGNFSCAVAPTYQIYYNNSEYNNQFVLWLGYDNISFTTLGYNLSYYVGENYVSNAVGNNGGFIFTGVKTISSGNNELDCMPYSDIDLDISWNIVPSVSITLELKSSDETSAQSESDIYVQVSNDGNYWYAPGTVTPFVFIPHISSSTSTEATLFSAGMARNTIVSATYTVSPDVTQIRFINNGDDRLFLDYFRLNGTDMTEIQGVISSNFWPTTSPGLGWSINSDDVQTSMNDTPIRTFSASFSTSNVNREGTIGRPYFIIRDQQNNRALLGYADLNYSDESNPYEKAFTNVVGPGNILRAGGYNTKFHKIKCEKKSLENPGSWDTTGIHICFQKPGISSDSSSLIYYKYKGPISGSPLGEEEFYHDPIAGGASATGKNPGGFCSMDVWGDNPRIAWYDSSFNSGSIWLAKSDDGGTTWDSSGVMIDDNVGTYQETGNKNYLSLTCDQKDGSVHISYFHNTEGIKYWTNSINAPKAITSAISNNQQDINAVDCVRRINLNNLMIKGAIDTGLPKRFDESNIDISWNQVDSSYNAIFSYRHPITNWNEIPNFVTITDNIVYSKRKTKYYTGEFDKIFVAARVKTNSTIYNEYSTLFLIGGETGFDGSYIGGLYYGAPYFGIQNNYLSSPIIKTIVGESNVPDPTGPITNSEFYLQPNTEYDLEYYYDKIKKYAFIKVNEPGEQVKIFEWNDISYNGGFNMNDGFLTIGNGRHTSEYQLWCGEKKDGIIKDIMIWNCDINHIPQYKLYRNDVEIKSGIKTPYFKDSSGVILDKIPDFDTNYKYKVSSMGNSINVSQNILADETKSQETPIRQLKDIWNMEYIPNQDLVNNIDGNIYVTAMDRMEDKIWATMSQDTGNTGVGEDNIYLVYSNDGGKTWQFNITFQEIPVLLNVKNVMARCLKLYSDPSGAEWCFIGTEGYGIFISNTYLEDNPTGQELGTTWKQISDTTGTTSSGNGLLGTYLKDSSSLEENRTITYIHPVDIVKSNSASLYGDTDATGSDIPDNTFHLWVGTESPWIGVIGNIDYSGPGAYWWSRSWSSGSSSELNVRDANLYNFTCVAYSMVVKINGKLYESGLSKLRLRAWTTKQSGSEQWYGPMFQTPDKLGNSDNGFIKPENFVEWRAYRSPEVITALNTGPIASGEYEGENEFSKKYKEIGFDVYLGGELNSDPSQGGISPKVTARTNPDNSNTYSAWLSVSPWLDSSYNWYYTESFSDFDVDTSQTKYPTYKKIGGYKGAQDMVIRGNYIDYSNNTLDYSKNIITYAQTFKGEGKISVGVYGTQPLVAFSYSWYGYGIKDVLAHVPGISTMTKTELINEITNNWVIGIEQQNGDGTGTGNFKFFKLEKSATHEVSNNNEDHTWIYLNVYNDSNEFHGIRGGMAFIKFYQTQGSESVEVSKDGIDSTTFYLKTQGDIFAAVYGTTPFVGLDTSDIKNVIGGFSGISNMDPTQLIDELINNWVFGIEQNGTGIFKVFQLEETHIASDSSWLYLNIINDNNDFHGMKDFQSTSVKFYRIFSPPEPDPSLESFNVIDFGVNGTDVNIGCIGGKHNIYKTIDGGKTWTATSLNSYDYNNRPGNSYLLGGSINGIFSNSRLVSGNTNSVYKSNNSSIRIENGLSEFTYFESLGDNYNNDLKFKAYIPEKPNIGLSIVESNNPTDLAGAVPAAGMPAMAHAATNSYWNYNNKSTYARIGAGNLIGDAKLKAAISDDNSNFWVFDHKNSIIKGSFDLLFHKDISDNWQRIELVDPVLDISAGITCIQPLKYNNLLTWVTDSSKDKTGFYKISKTPPTPILELLYPAENNDFRAQITITNSDIFYAYKSAKQNIKFKWFEKIDGTETMNPSDPIGIENYSLSFDLIPASEYEFRVVAQNEYGDSWFQTVSLTTPEAAPDLRSFSVTDTFINVELNWTYQLDNFDATNITQYSISREELNVKTDTSNNLVLFDVDSGSGLSNIPPINYYRDVNDLKLNHVYTYYITPYAVDKSGSTLSQVITLGSGIPEFFKGLYHPKENKIVLSWLTDKINVEDNSLKNTTVSWEILKVRIDDISIMDTIEGVSGETIYQKQYIISSDFLVPNYSYSFSVRAHYQNEWFNEKSDWTKPLIFNIEAPAPKNIIVNYNTETDNIIVTWLKASFHTLPKTYTVRYSYNSIVVEKEIENTRLNINGRSLPGGVNVLISVKANYPKFSSAYSDPQTKTIPLHKPININIQGYLEGTLTNEKATSVHISWDACEGAIDYTLKRFDLYYLNTSIDIPDFTTTITTNSYVDNNYPLGTETVVPRRYVYRISANY